MGLNGLNDIYLFLNTLKAKKIWYRLDHLREDSIMVTIHLICIRIEVDFFADHIEYSWYSGDESVHGDQVALLDLIAKHS